MTATRPPPPPAPLLDGELALHAALAVAGHGAEERVVAGLEIDVDRRRAAALDDVALLVDAVALERDVVRVRLIVDGVDLELAGGRLGVGELERETGADRDRELAA